ncbi:unnamed protein product [Brachionus calyciflorus]|uniref:HAT C-terminal dimerisation domain-containing protein n=1 Tax=Brachionus calyciflorus TaxID=104777 RepID=A0A813QEI8_9BILA|nr:unnamed protein product [Brachionus calyciflorus]
MGRMASASHKCSRLAESIADNFKLSIPTPDPRYKDKWIHKLRLVSSSILSLKTIVRNEIVSYAIKNKYVDETRPISVTSPQYEPLIQENHSKKRKLKIDLMSYLTYNETVSQNENLDNSELKRFENELDIYLNEINENIESYIFKYWEKRSLDLRVLSSLARDIFSIQASSAPIERYFSCSTFLMRPHRIRFTYKNLSNLMF